MSGLQDLPGRSVTTVEGTASVAFLQDEAGITARQAPDLDTALDDLADGATDAVVFDSAVVAYFAGQHSRVIELLYQAIPRFQQVAIGIGARVYFCRALWMQGELEWLLSALKGFQQFLTRTQEVSRSDKARYRMYTKMFRKMVLAASEPGGRAKVKMARLREAMAAAERPETLGWLMEQARSWEQKGPTP